MSTPVYGMALTPLCADGTLDTSSLHSYAAQLAADGCDAIIGLGVIAEPDELTLSEKVAIIEGLLGAGLPVYATILRGADSTAIAQARTLAASFRGALSGLMVAVSRPSARGLRSDLEAIAEASDLPLIVQDYPIPTRIEIGIDELLAAIDGMESVVAIKEEGMPTVARIRALRQDSDIRILTGLGGTSLAHDLLAGADAVACGISRPDRVRAALEVWDPADPEATQRAMDELTALITVETQPTTSVAFRKEHWRRRGAIAHNTVRAGSRPYAPWMRAHSALAGYADSAP